MPKPLNHKEEGCNPVSSNCVIWQGPYIECINLCPGDTVSDVVFKLSTELCKIIDVTLNISTYQEAVSCFNLAIGAGAPANFQQLIELLTKRICNLETCTGCTPDCNGNSQMEFPETLSTPCCDTLVPIAPCFYYIDPGSGDTVTELGLSDYVHLIGNKICDILAALTTHGISITNLNARVTNLENAPLPTYIPPQITPVCVLPSVATDPFDVLTALEAQFCLLQASTGDPNLIQTRIPAPAGLANSDQLCGPGKISDLVGWVDPAGTMADTIANMWVVMMDMRCAIQNALLCCPHGCDGVVITMTVDVVGTYLKFYFNGTLPAGYVSCLLGGSIFTITDSMGNSASTPIRIEDYINTGTSYNFNLALTSIDSALDIDVVSTACMKNNTDNTLCEKYLSYHISNTAPCPTVTLVSNTATTLSYSFNSTTGNTTYTIELWTSDGVTMISTQSVVTTTITSVGGVFVGLTSSTSYRVRVLVTKGVNTTTCPDQLKTTLAAPCVPPATVSATIGIIP